MPATSKNWFTDLLLLTVLLSCFFGAFLGSRALNVPDEGRYAEIPREMVASGDYVTPHINFIKYFEKPPFVYWLQAATIKTFGESEWPVRFPTALMALLGCLFTYVAGRKLYNRRTGWLSSFILATSLLYYVMARFITLDMTVSVLLAGCLFSFILASEALPGKSRQRFLWAMYIFSALAVLTKGLIGIIFPGMVIFIWMLCCNDWRNLRSYLLPSGIILWLAIVLPWHILVQLRNPEFFNFYIIKQQFLRYLTPYAHRQQPLWYLPVFFILGFFPWNLFLVQAIKKQWPKWQTRLQHKITLFLLFWAALIYLFFQISHSQLPPYLLPVFFPLALLIGNYFSTIWESKSKGFSIGLILSSAILTLIGITGLVLPHYLPYFKQIPATTLVSLFLALTTAWIPWLFYVKGQVKGAIISLMISLALLFTSANLSGDAFEVKSIKPLAVHLAPLLKPTDVVVSYHTYFQDLPFYLQRRIVIAGWGDNELEFGMQHQNMNGWFWDDATLWQQWSGPARIFLFLSQNDYNSLSKKLPGPLYLIEQTSRNVLITNQSLN